MDIPPPLTKFIPRGEGKKFANICKYILNRLAIDKGYNFIPLDDSSGDPFGVDSISKPNSIGNNFQGYNGNVGFAYTFKPSSDEKLWSKIMADCLKAQGKYKINKLSLLIIVLPENLQMHKIEQFNEKIKNLKLNFNVQFYGHEDLWPLFMMYPEMVSEFYHKLYQANPLLIKEILLKVEICCHSFKSEYTLLYPEPFQIRNGDKYEDIWDQMEKVTNHQYSLSNWKKYKNLFDKILINIVRELNYLDSTYSEKIPDEIRAIMIQVIKQLELEIYLYLSLPDFLRNFPYTNENVFFNVRIKEVIRQLAKLSRKSKENRQFIELQTSLPV